MKFNTYQGKKVEGSYERYLEESKGKKEIIKPEIKIPSTGFDNGDYIFMPQRKLYVAKQRSHLDKTWYQAHQALQDEDARMLTIREFVDFLNILRNGNDEFKKIYSDITEVRDPYRAEWLDAKFSSRGILNKTYSITYHKINSNGNLEEVTEPLLDNYIANDKKVDLGDWLQKATIQGLPSLNTNEGSLYYWSPVNGRVARFGADSDGALLNCGGNPGDSNSSLGVRAARRAPVN